MHPVELSTASLPHSATATTETARARLSSSAPLILVVAVCAFSMLRNGVEAADLASFVAYWLICVLAPGFFVHRLFMELRPTLVEDLAFAAMTGIALETIAWIVLSRLELEALIGWWWLLPWAVIAFAAIRRRPSVAVPRYTERSSLGWRWAIAGLSTTSVIAIDVAYFRPTPLPPEGGSTYQDMWWHLSLIPEVLRSGPTEYPQIVGEQFTYHLNAHAHVAIASRIARIDPEVVLFRLWVVPIVILTVLVTAGLARQLTGRQWSGPVAAWIGVSSLVGGFLVVDRGVVAAWPLTYLSPSQLLANPMIIAVISAIAALLRSDLTRGRLAWLLLIALAAAGTKTTVVPILLGATAVAWLAMVLIRRGWPRRLTVIGFGFAGLEGWTLLTSSSSAGGSLTVLGTLKTVSFYREMSGDSALRAVNEGVFLDSLSTSIGFRSAMIALAWFVVSHLPRLVGCSLVLTRRRRSDPVVWFLFGTIAAAWGATFSFDHVGASQLYFLHSVSCVGGVLTAWLVSDRLDSAESSFRPRSIVLGLAGGAGIAVVAAGVGTALRGRASAGPAQQFLAAGVVAVVLTIALLAVARRSTGTFRFGIGLLLTATTLGIAIPPSVEVYAARVATWLVADRPVANPDDAGFVSAAEQQAMRWLRSQSQVDDVVVTNLHCRAPTNTPVYCDARGFWVSGLAGRRVVLEGWAYTAQAQVLQGLGNRTYANQLSPFPRRYELSEAIFLAPTAAIVDELQRDFTTQWAVYVERAGPISDEIEEYAELQFDNGEVRIYELSRP